MNRPIGDDQPINKRRLIVFADDWGRHPSSCQHLVRNLLDECEVSWINTIGTRPPRLSRVVFRRSVEKVFQWSKGCNGSASVTAPRVMNPVMYPGFRSGWQRRLNVSLLASLMN